MGTRVYVGNIPFSYGWQEVKDHFKQIGPVVRADVLELPDGRSKGCAIVEYRTEEDASRAIKMLRDSQLGTRQLYVREDREEMPRHGGSRGGWGGRGVNGPPGGHSMGGANGGGYGGRGGWRSGGGGGYGHNQPGGWGRGRQRGQEDARRIFVTNLQAGTSNDAVRDFFMQYGNVLEVSLIGRGDLEKQSATVAFETEDSARAAIEQANNSEMGGRVLVVREDRYGVAPPQE